MGDVGRVDDHDADDVLEGRLAGVEDVGVGEQESRAARIRWRPTSMPGARWTLPVMLNGPATQRPRGAGADAGAVAGWRATRGGMARITRVGSVASAGIRLGPGSSDQRRARRHRRSSRLRRSVRAARSSIQPTWHRPCRSSGSGTRPPQALPFGPVSSSRTSRAGRPERSIAGHDSGRRRFGGPHNQRPKVLVGIVRDDRVRRFARVDMRGRWAA